MNRLEFFEGKFNFCFEGQEKSLVKAAFRQASDFLSVFIGAIGGCKISDKNNLVQWRHDHMAKSMGGHRHRGFSADPFPPQGHMGADISV